MPRKPIAISVGEPAGIGPDIVIQAAQRQHRTPWLAIADPRMLQQRATLLGLPLDIAVYDPAKPIATAAKKLTVLPIPCRATAVPGQSDATNAQYVVKCIETAVQLCLKNEAAAMVTGPVDKSVINQGGIPFSGHTEYIADLTGTRQPVMMMAADQLKVALVTWHIPLKAVPAAITRDHLTHILKIVQQDLVARFKIAKPRIAVCGLNPHAGERGYLGQEELITIIPTLELLKAEGLDLIGPLPADSAFTEHERSRYDVIVAMYHDQGLAPIKALHFQDAVNITLGLPIIRTSVDHGTAVTLAGTGKADAGSLLAAIRWAGQLQ